MTSQQIAAAERLDQFAELLSLGLETLEISERMGIGRRRATLYLGRLRSKYGWQAA